MLVQKKNLFDHHDDKTKIVYLLIVIVNDVNNDMFDLFSLNQNLIQVTFQFSTVVHDLNK